MAWTLAHGPDLLAGMSTQQTPCPDPATQPTVPVPVAGAILGVSRATAYEAARTGQLPTIRLGTRIVVPVAALRRLLELDDVPTA
jgi:hypothetical protein